MLGKDAHPHTLRGDTMKPVLSLLLLVPMLTGCADCAAGTMNCSPERRAGTTLGLILLSPVLLADEIGSAVRDASHGPPPPPQPPVATSLPLTAAPERRQDGLATGVLTAPVTRDGWVCDRGRAWFEIGSDRILGCTLAAERRLGPDVVPPGNALLCRDDGRCTVWVEMPQGVRLGGRIHSSGQIIHVAADGSDPRPLFGQR